MHGIQRNTCLSAALVCHAEGEGIGASPTPSPDPASWPTQSTSSYQSIMEAISQADSLSDLKNRRQAYQQVNSLIAQLLPAVPLVYPVSAVTYRPAIKNYQVRANCMDDFSSLSIQG